MFSTYLKVTLRTFVRERRYALINVAGLALGIGCCLILGLYLRGELTYDRHNVRHAQIFRIASEINANGKIDSFAVSSAAMGPMLVEDFPEIEGYVRLRRIGQRMLIHHEDQSFYWDDTFLADSNVFDVFTHDIIYGDPHTALIDPDGVAVSETFARRYLGAANPIGATITSDNGQPRTINLVFADLPANAHVRYDVLFSYNRADLAVPENMTARNQSLWGVSDFTYLLLPAGYDVRAFATIAETFYERHMAAQGSANNASWRYWLEPLAGIHLHSDLGYDEPPGNRLYLYGFAAVAVFILIVACINYMNLATARAMRRAREVGMRKILGAGRAQLIAQFLGEALAFAFVALLAGLILVEVALTLTPITSLLGKPVTFSVTNDPQLLGWLAGLGLAVGLLSGLYPALYLSSMRPLSALVKTRAGKGAARFREALVLVQFTISVAVIAATLLMALQMRYIANKSLGFAPENRIVISLRGVDLIDKIPVIRTELSQNEKVLGVTTSSSVIGKTFPINGAQIDNNDGMLETQTLSHMGVDESFLETMGIALLQGRDFRKRRLTDVGATFIVNEAMVRYLGWQDPIGKRINLGANTGRVVGVVADFHFRSLHNVIEPFALYPLVNDFANVQPQFRPFQLRYLTLNIAGEGIRDTLSWIEGKFAELDPRHPFEFEFLDDSLQKLYESERHLVALVAIFAGVCIFIACLGLYGLAAFTTEQRSKEIGIRKVLGASSAQIIVLLARRILMLVVAGAIVASIAAYFTMDSWLAGFAYRAAINPAVFPAAAIAAATVAFVTVALQSFRTARANPVDALRYE